MHEMESRTQPQKLPRWISLVGDLKLVTEFLATKPYISAWLPVIFVDALCRAFAQVLFANNSLTGFAIVLALFIGDAMIASAGVFSTAVGLIASVCLQQPRANVCSGLTTYSAVIVGTVIMALSPAYIDDRSSDLVWLFIFFGAIFSVYLTIGMVNILSTVKPALPCCTLPFNAVTFMSLICFQIIAKRHQGPPTQNVMENLAIENNTDHIDHVHKLFVGTILSMSQVYAVESVAGSIVIYVGLFFCSPITAVMSFIGSAVGTFVGASILGPSGYAAAYSGLLGFNSLLSAAGLGGFFWVMSIRCFATATLCALFTVVIQITFASTLDLASLPVCTLPFCTSTILFLATTTAFGGLQRPKTVSFPEMHLYDLHARSSNPSVFEIENPRQNQEKIISLEVLT